MVSLEDYLMAEPENHTLRLLREIRGAIGTLDDGVDSLDKKVDSLDKKVDSLDKKVDRNHEELKRRIESIRQAAFGESVLGR